LASFYGIVLAGGVVVPIAVTTDQRRIVEIAVKSRASIILTKRDQHPLNFGCQLPEVWLDEAIELARDITLPGLQNTADTLAAVMFTAGSTGKSKGVMLSHRNLVSNALAIQRYLSLTKEERPLCLLPFQHAFGNSIVQSHVLSGGCLVAGPTYQLPHEISRSAIANRVTSISAVPTIMQLLHNARAWSALRSSTLRYISVAGGALSSRVALEVAERIRPAELYLMYGQTEATARISYLPPAELARRPTSVGRGLDNLTLEVVDASGERVNPSEIGELRVTGPSVMLGYWEDDEATRQVLRDGWLYTGDSASIDEDGWVYLRGRKHSWLKIGGNRVHPQQLEDHVNELLRSNQAIVIPFQDHSGNDRLALFVTGGNLAIAEIMQHLRRSLPNYLIPTVIRSLTELPLLPSAKVDRSSLSQLAASEYVTTFIPCDTAIS
jgi:acyl-CoA synthetase (AMP-forming)/AMP-acid ligase II